MTASAASTARRQHDATTVDAADGRLGAALETFLAYGRDDDAETRALLWSRAACFDPDLYLELNPDVAAAGVDPLRHYIEWGFGQQRPLRRDRLRSDEFLWRCLLDDEREVQATLRLDLRGKEALLVGTEPSRLRMLLTAAFEAGPQGTYASHYGQLLCLAALQTGEGRAAEAAYQAFAWGLPSDVLGRSEDVAVRACRPLTIAANTSSRSGGLLHWARSVVRRSPQAPSLIAEIEGAVLAPGWPVLATGTGDLVEPRSGRREEAARLAGADTSRVRLKSDTLLLLALPRPTRRIPSAVVLGGHPELTPLERFVDVLRAACVIGSRSQGPEPILTVALPAVADDLCSILLPAGARETVMEPLSIDLATIPLLSEVPIGDVITRLASLRRRLRTAEAPAGRGRRFWVEASGKAWARVHNAPILERVLASRGLDRLDVQTEGLQAQNASAAEATLLVGDAGDLVPALLAPPGTRIIAFEAGADDAAARLLRSLADALGIAVSFVPAIPSNPLSTDVNRADRIVPLAALLSALDRAEGC